MMRVDVAACEHHFVDHIALIWHALAPTERGTWHAATQEMADHARSLGVESPEVSQAALTSPHPLLIASYGDLRLLTVGTRGPRPGGKPGARVSGAGMTTGRLRRPLIFLEHGAGQTYQGVTSPSYSGGSRRGPVRLYLAPGAHVAAANAAAYPDTPTAVVGCPKLDAAHALPPKARGPRPTVAVSFHWDAVQVCPEAVSAFEHYRQELARLARMPDLWFDLIGHAHPKRWPELSHWWRSIGVEPVQHFADVIERADVFVVDNSSTLYEFASLDRPVVVLNAPWYRRDVEHGLRFWSHAGVGVQVAGPHELASGIVTACADPPDVAAERRRIVADVYDRCDGRAAQRAAAAIRAAMAPPQVVTMPRDAHSRR